MSGRVVHFELPADDLGRAKAFYAEAFGWTFTPNPGQESAMVSTTPTNDHGVPTEPGAINGGIAARATPITAPLITVDVPDIDEALKQIEKLGGTRVQDRTPVGDFGFVAYFTDTEGNTVGLWQYAAS